VHAEQCSAAALERQNASWHNELMLMFRRSRGCVGTLERGGGDCPRAPQTGPAVRAGASHL